MALFRKEDRRFVQVVFRFLLVGLRYRSDRKEILRAQGKIANPEKYREHGRKAVEAFIELGPAFVKLGQLLSVRPDVLPEPYVEEFARLQDDVPPAPFEQVKPVIEASIGPIDGVFDSFDPSAVSGASLGQVYQARYKGVDVVVKVNRPGIGDEVSVDTKVLRRLVPLVGRFIDRGLRTSAESIVDQFSLTILEEMNYKKEAEHLLAIKRNLRSEREVIVPDLFSDLSSGSVLVMKRMTGIKIGDVKALDDAGIDRKRLARKVARVFLAMLLGDEIFHADPHPGNISVTGEGKIILYDYGMVGTLDEDTRTNLIRFYLALLTGDPDKVVDMMLRLGILDPMANRVVVRRGIELAIADMHGRNVEETEVRALMEVANRTIYQFPFRLPKNLVLYMRMSSILEGVCVTLDPDFRFVRMLGGLLEDEGLVSEAYKMDIIDEITKLRSGLEATIEVAPLLKSALEDYHSRESARPRGRGPFLSGAIAGVSVSGLVASAFYFGTVLGKAGFAVSLFLLAVAALVARR
ncbi:MAG: AarF/ABC1/UbiB kinase family protein [Nitrososphaerota archaeon]|jgi:predicted unusual protein kinase regulating ubiquinone biosynthesis (AarF/ABC1/UbiB family)|nr:AarF/ABC1/UbiB kinase family protein [Nitrososphaerota archaeon]MDG6960747.1 AarF/ABC1/UbiB kinase family protein [Nitrososphaerota archaeon]MDG6987043.1 AarF/ABC1/UbiB kinase family protein [Nitrososphaerota archaeon]MDG7004315.1 AarF/ABC1/UbiB kinase family protein [Nitrososphaerota archaeon]MDG7031078.1 AarF/ABC1/UbiB kinase family protein [Nitrososphaerota archaeon]